MGGNNNYKFKYEIIPSNFFSLPDEKQKMMVTRFLRLLRDVGNAGIVLKKENISYNDSLLEIVRTYVVSEERIDGLLNSLEFKYKPVEELTLPKAARENPKGLVLVDNVNSGTDETQFARCFTLYSLPGSSQIAWVYSLTNYCTMVVIRVRKVDHDQAVSSVKRYAGLVKAASTTGTSLLEKASKVETLFQALVAQKTALFKLRLNCVIVADDKKELVEQSKLFKKRAKSMNFRFDDTAFKQYDMLPLDSKNEGGWWGKELSLEFGSLAILYPFVSSDLLEVDGGIMLGVNTETGSPIVYDYRLRDNYNALILATSGAGKSVTAKMMLKRLLEKYNDALTFVIDPQGEYEGLTDYLSLKKVRITDTDGNELGLDPFKLFESKYDAAEVICDITNAPDVIRKHIRSKASEAIDIFSLSNIVSEDAKKYLVDLVNEPLATIFKGESTLGTRNVISMKGTYGDEDRVGMLLLLALAKAWREINNAPVQTPKILLIDEGWMLFNIPSAARFVNTIARVGRKLNVIFIFITQRPEDVIANEYGRAILDNADTKILLKNNELAASKIADALQLSEQEREMLVNFVKGEALMLTKDYRLRVKFMPSHEELKMFSTTPV